MLRPHSKLNILPSLTLTVWFGKWWIFPLSFGSLSLFFASKIYLVYSVIFYHKILFFWGSLVKVSGLICFLIRNHGYLGQLSSVKFKSLQFPTDHLQVIQRFRSVLAMSFLFSLLLHVHRSQFLSFTTSPTPPPPLFMKMWDDIFNFHPLSFINTVFLLLLTLCTQVSVCIFSTLFSIHFRRCWQGEFV